MLHKGVIDECFLLGSIGKFIDSLICVFVKTVDYNFHSGY